MTQREYSITHLAATRAPGAVLWIRIYVGLIFVGEGVLKFAREDSLGSGRFIKAGIPMGTFLANLDGAFEIGLHHRGGAPRATVTRSPRVAESERAE